MRDRRNTNGQLFSPRQIHIFWHGPVKMLSCLLRTVYIFRLTNNEAESDKLFCHVALSGVQRVVPRQLPSPSRDLLCPYAGGGEIVSVCRVQIVFRNPDRGRSEAEIPSQTEGVGVLRAPGVSHSDSSNVNWGVASFAVGSHTWPQLLLCLSQTPSCGNIRHLGINSSAIRMD